MLFLAQFSTYSITVDTFSIICFLCVGMDILYVWTVRRSTIFCNEMLSSELTAIENHHEVEVHLHTIFVFYIISEVDTLRPWS